MNEDPTMMDFLSHYYDDAALPPQTDAPPPTQPIEDPAVADFLDQCFAGATPPQPPIDATPPSPPMTDIVTVQDWIMLGKIWENLLE